MILFSQLGLSDNYKTQETIHSHPWNRENEWVLCPDPVAGWGETTKDSRWELKPPAGDMYIATHCFVQCSCDILVTPERALIVEGVFDDADEAGKVEITRFSYLDILTSRASEKRILDPNTGHGAGATPGETLTKRFYELKIPFAHEVLLWSSAALTGGQPALDGAGNAKFRKMIVRIGDNEPYTNAAGTAPAETTLSRYFCDVYTDPDYTA